MKIVLSVILTIFLMGCGEDKPATTKDELTKQVAQTLDEVSQKSEKVVTEVKENIVEVSQETKKTTQEAVEEMQKKAEVAVEKSRVAVANVIAPAPSKPAIDGQTVYKACIGCHGVNAQNKALNKSQVIKGWKSSKIIEALHGYKDGTYGSTMKGVMKSQVSKLSDEDIKAVAEYISKL